MILYACLFAEVVCVDGTIECIGATCKCVWMACTWWSLTYYSTYATSPRGQNTESQDVTAWSSIEESDAMLSLKSGEPSHSLPMLSSPIPKSSLLDLPILCVVLKSTACCSAISQLVLNDACSQLVVKVSGYAKYNRDQE